MKEDVCTRVWFKCPCCGAWLEGNIVTNYVRIDPPPRLEDVKPLGEEK